MVGILNIIVIVEHFQKLIHLLDILFVCQLCIGLGNHGYLGACHRDTCCLQCFAHCGEIIGCGCDFVSAIWYSTNVDL